MYTNQSIKVRWGQTVSSEFSVSNGIKQGGILFPILFAVYIDEILILLKESNLGCHIGHLFLGALACADDVSLIAPTRQTIMKMLEIANFFSVEFNIKSNLSKCQLIYYNNDKNSTESDISVEFNDYYS